jgi:hypothetical protein
MKKNHFVILIYCSIALLFVGGYLFWPSTTANAQCGSQASSCKNCHEVQGEKPVNNDGTQWHQPHAFGDFCEFCHAGNVQSTVKAEAHTGMVDPLSDPETSCSQCHDNYLDLAQDYASVLGVEVGTASTTTTSAPAEAAAAPEPTPTVSISSAPQPVAQAEDKMVVDPGDLVDFNKQYDETVLGIRDLNVGNVILAGLILVVLMGGGLFVIVNEGWVHVTTEPILDTVDGFSKDSVSLLPDIEKLDGSARKALKKLLKKPGKATKVFEALADLENKD